MGEAPCSASFHSACNPKNRRSRLLALRGARRAHWSGRSALRTHRLADSPAMGVALDRVLRSALPAALLLTSAVRGL